MGCCVKIGWGKRPFCLHLFTFRCYGCTLQAIQLPGGGRHCLWKKPLAGLLLLGGKGEGGRPLPTPNQHHCDKKQNTPFPVYRSRALVRHRTIYTGRNRRSAIRPSQSRAAIIADHAQQKNGRYHAGNGRFANNLNPKTTHSPSTK